MTKPTPAALHAALKAIRTAVDGAIQQTQDEAIAEYRERGTDRWRTPCGSVSVSKSKPKPAIADEAAFFDWVKRNRPAEIVESVRGSFRSAFMRKLRVHGDKVLYEGEVLDFATVRPGGDLWLLVRDADEAQAMAATAVRANLEEIAARYATPELGAGDD